ncbi:hypothetical protein [Actinoplanes sp. NPDC049802]|uniref:hypothetical protein n=1 Tax=Actinoplanes sp. NPDC049802 TaxID=3154742 RepID=UPI0033E302C7
MNGRLTSRDPVAPRGAVTAGIVAFPVSRGTVTARAGRPGAGVAAAGAAVLDGPPARKAGPT